MDEYVMKQKIQKSFVEPGAPEELIQRVILRSKAVTMGVQAQKQLEAAPAEKLGELVSHVIVSQLALVSELPKGVQPEQLAQQLEQQPAFQAALHGGNVIQRLNNGMLLRQITDQKPAAEPTEPEISIPKKQGPIMG